MRTIIFSLFVWLIFVVSSLPAATDPTFLDTATQAASWILSREVEENSKIGYWPSRQDLPVEEKCDLYYGNAGVILFLQELYRATSRKEYAEAIQRGIGFLDQNLPEVKLYGLYDGLAGIAYSLAQQSDNPEASALCSKAVDRLIEGASKQSNGGVRWNDDNDIMSGSAGVGLTPLAPRHQLHRPQLNKHSTPSPSDSLATFA